jgi:hypothetical protein
MMMIESRGGMGIGQRVAMTLSPTLKIIIFL